MRRRLLIVLALFVLWLSPFAGRAEFHVPGQRARALIHGVVGRVIGMFFDKGGAVWNIRAYGADCGAAAAATTAGNDAMAAALLGAKVAGGTALVPSGCQPVFTGPAADGASFTVESNVTVRCEAGALLHAAYMTCSAGTTASGSSAIGAGCTTNGECGTGGLCVGVGTFAPAARNSDGTGTYTLFQAAASATSPGIVDCQIDTHQISATGHCTAGSTTNACTTTTASVCTTCGAGTSPSGPGSINPVDYSNGATTAYSVVRRVEILNQLRAKFAVALGTDGTAENVRNTRTTVTQSGGAAATYVIDFGVYGQGQSLDATRNRLQASTFGIFADGVSSAVTADVSVNRNRILCLGSGMTTGIYLATGWYQMVAQNYVDSCVYPYYNSTDVTDPVVLSNVFRNALGPTVVQGAGVRMTDNYIVPGGTMTIDTAAMVIGGDDTSNTPRCSAGTKKHYPCTTSSDCPPSSSPCFSAAKGIAHAQVTANEYVVPSGGAGIRAGNTGRRCSGGTVERKTCAADGDCTGGGTCLASTSEASAVIVGNNIMDLGGTTIAVDLSGVGSTTGLGNWELGPNLTSTCDTGYKFPTPYTSNLSVMNVWSVTTPTNWDSRFGTLAPGTPVVSPVVATRTGASCSYCGNNAGCNANNTPVNVACLTATGFTGSKTALVTISFSDTDNGSNAEDTLWKMYDNAGTTAPSDCGTTLPSAGAYMATTSGYTLTGRASQSAIMSLTFVDTATVAGTNVYCLIVAEPSNNTLHVAGGLNMTAVEFQ